MLKIKLKDFPVTVCGAIKVQALSFDAVAGIVCILSAIIVVNLNDNNGKGM